MQPTRTPAPALPDEILEDIFLRLPPDEPECLLRCSLASKLWLGRLTAPSFHTRYREFHGAAPMLGFVYSWPPESGPIFVSTTKFGPRYHPEDEGSDVLDCRHGRVLLRKKGVEHMTLVVWDPMTGSRREMIHTPKDDHCYVHRAAVLCAEAGCDHRACHGGPFQVVLVALDKSRGYRVAEAYMSLPEVGQYWDKWCSDDLHLVDQWIDPCASVDLQTNNAFNEHTPPVFIAGALFFMLWNDYHNHIEILEYNIGSNFLSLLDVSPVGVHIGSAPILMAMEDGTLGLAYQDRLTLNLWSRLISSDGVVTWIERRIIDLKEVLPIQIPEQTRLIGSVEGSDIIFVITDLGIYEINIKSLRQKKIWKRERLCTLIPYMSFHDSRGMEKH